MASDHLRAMVMAWGRMLCLATAIGVLAGVALADRAPDPPVTLPCDGTTPPFELSSSHLLRHIGTYRPLHLHWQLDNTVPGATAVFPDPHLPAHALIATGQGMVETVDDGQTWRAVAGAADKFGQVNCLLFGWDALNTYYVGTETRGIWMTNDAGKTFQQLASKANGLAADTVVNLYWYPADVSHQTLLATHGDAAPGISRSMDLGVTWQVLYPGYQISHLAFHGNSQEMFLAAAAVEHPDVHNIYYIPSPDEPWENLLADVNCVGLVAPLLSRNSIYVCTADKGIFRLTGNDVVPRNVGPANHLEWASLGCTFSANADREMYYAYDPKNLGLVTMTAQQLDSPPPADTNDQTAPPAYIAQNEGLPNFPLVMEGAQVRANANGTVFYAVVNKTLYVGQNTGSSVVRAVTIDPPLWELHLQEARTLYTAIEQSLDAFNSDRNVLHAAASLQPKLRGQLAQVPHITVTARVEYPQNHPPRAVTVDLSRLGLSQSSPLLALGQPDQPDARAGVYANTFYLNTESAVDFEGRFGQDWRAHALPVTMGLSVSAMSDRGPLAGAVGVLAVFREPPRSFPAAWDAPTPITGDVKGNNLWHRTRGNVISLKIATAGDWSATLRASTPHAMDFSGCHSLSFLIAADHDTTDDLLVNFRDQPNYALSSTSDPVPIIKEGYLPAGKITTDFQRVTIPVSRILKNHGKLETSNVTNIIFSATCGAPVELLIKDIRFYPSEEDIPTDTAGN